MQKQERIKGKVLSTIENLNVEILKDFIELKRTFESSHISNSQISNKLKEWKPTFQVTVNRCLEQLLQELGLQNQQGAAVDYISLVKELTKTYGLDQQYIEKIKCLNSSTDMIKEYIRIKAIKDPTTAVIEKQSIQNQNNVTL